VTYDVPSTGTYLVYKVRKVFIDACIYLRDIRVWVLGTADDCVDPTPHFQINLRSCSTLCMSSWLAGMQECPTCRSMNHRHQHGTAESEFRRSFAQTLRPIVHRSYQDLPHSRTSLPSRSWEGKSATCPYLRGKTQ